MLGIRCTIGTKTCLRGPICFVSRQTISNHVDAYLTAHFEEHGAEKE